jgi:hypothetical protein
MSTNFTTARLLISVTRLGEISPFGRNFFALGAFFSKKYRPNDLGAFFFKNIAQNSPK